MLSLDVLSDDTSEALLNANSLDIEVASDPAHDLLKVDGHLLYSGHAGNTRYHWVLHLPRLLVKWLLPRLLVRLLLPRLLVRLLGHVHARYDLQGLLNHLEARQDALVEDHVVETLKVQLRL